MPQDTPYLRVADDLRRRIRNNEWQPGQPIPSRARLATHYNVGVNVIQKATTQLIIEGLLEGRAGSGTYVRPPRDRRLMVRTRHRENRGGSPFRADMAEHGQKGTWEAHTQARTPAPEHIATRLAINPGDLCVHTRYEFFADGEPAQLSWSWEPQSVTDGTPVMLPEMGPYAGAGVVDRMAAIGVVIDTCVEIPRPARATQEQANLLGVPLGSLLLIIERTYYDASGRPVETADIAVSETRFDVAYEFDVDKRR